MTYDAQISIRQGSKRPLYAEAIGPSELSGTGVLQAGGTFTLYNSDGSLAPGLSGVAISGYDMGPSEELRVWYLLDTAPLSVGDYSAVFRFTATGSGSGSGSDELDRTFEVDIGVTITAAVEVIATYNETQLATSHLFQTRLHCADTAVGNAIWSDAELNYFLLISSDIPFLAAANALETLALDRAKFATVIRIGSFGSSEAEAYKAIAERAVRLRMLAPTLPVVRAPDRVFFPDECTLSGSRNRGNMAGW